MAYPRRNVGAGYPRVLGPGSSQPRRYPGLGPMGHPDDDMEDQSISGGYIAGYVAGMQQSGAAMNVGRHHRTMGHSAPWRDMVAPGVSPVQEGHVALPMNAETYSGTWSGPSGTGTGAASAGVGATIIFSARPQKPFKLARLLVRGTKVGTTAIGNLIGLIFVGTDLQQGELGNIDLESIGAATAFDTWMSFKQAEPGVWIRCQATLTAFPTASDYEVYTITALGHYLH